MRKYVVAGLLLAGCELSALPPDQRIRQYAHTAWTREGGQLQAPVRALAQTQDGRLWVGTDSGLLHFDGVRFGHWRPSPSQRAPSDSVLALAAAADGSLWIGTREGLSHWINERVEKYQTSRGPGGPGTAAIAPDTGASAWVGTAGYRSGGLCKVEGGTLHCFNTAEEPASAVYALLRDSGTALWAGGTRLARLDGGTRQLFPLPDANETIYALAEGRHGEIWVGASGLKRVERGRLAPYTIPGIDSKLRVRALLVDRDGALWIGTGGKGLIRLFRGRIDRFTQADGLSSDLIFCLLQDREGNIWVGTDGGLDSFRELTVVNISRRDGLAPGTVGPVYSSRRGGVWVGTSHGLNRVKRDEILLYGKRDGLPSDHVSGIFEERSGRLWLATDAGLARWDESGIHLLSLPEGRKIWFAAAAEDRDHSVWLSDPEHGLIRLRNARIAEVVPWSAFQDKQAWALEADPEGGGLWLGFAQGGVAYYRHGQPTGWYATGGRSRSAPVMDLHRMADGSLWIATGEGVSRLAKGHSSPLALANVLPCERIYALVEDDSGALWLSTECGLARIAAANLRKWYSGMAVQPRIYDTGDGVRRMPTALGYFRRAVKSGAGRLWFAASDSVLVVDPNHMPTNDVPPGVRIERISTRSIAAFAKEVQIDYTALSFVAPDKVRFRYRLDGLEREWHEAGGRRQVTYTNLRPGDYRFLVTACNNDGVWNETGTWGDFAIAPAFYQTPWFRALSAALFALGLWGAYRVRLRQMRRRIQARFQERAAERTRIAQEMHDTLLQNICGIALEVEGLSKNPSLPEATRHRLREMRKEAERCLREAREFLWELRSPTFEQQDLPQALLEAGVKITDGAPVQFHVTVNGNRRPAGAKLQKQLLRIVQEATRNAVRYGGAKEIEVKVAYLDRDLIRLQMIDDGCGFDMEQASRKAGHWGLITMRERARQIGAELKISSAPGSGTTLDLVVQAAPASD